MSTNDPSANRAVFLSARFAGGRFDTHTMPLEVLPDLASYRRLVVEVAKHLFKLHRGDRVRVPRGFEQSFKLAVSKVQGGSSSTAELVLADADSQQTLFCQHAEFEQARDLVAEVIRKVSAGGKLPAEFPPNLVGLFNPFGQNLMPDEFIEMSIGGQPPAKYTDGVRRAIVLSSEQIYERSVDGEFTLNGGVVDTGTIHVRDQTGRSLDFQPASQFEFDEAYRRAKGRVRLVGTGLFDAADSLRRLLSVSVHFDRPAFHLELQRSFADAKASLGEREVLDKERVGAALESLERLIQDNTDPNLEVGTPYVYVLEDGEISIEWTRDLWEASIGLSSSGAQFTIHALQTDSGQTYWRKVSANDGSQLAESLSTFFSTITSGSEGD